MRTNTSPAARTARHFPKIWSILTALVYSWFAASPASALDILIDVISGLTPGDTIGGGAIPQGGGPVINLADDVVNAQGKASFIKPDVPILAITYRNETTGQILQWLTTSDNGELHEHLRVYPITGIARNCEFAVGCCISPGQRRTRPCGSNLRLASPILRT